MDVPNKIPYHTSTMCAQCANAKVLSDHHMTSIVQEVIPDYRPAMRTTISLGGQDLPCVITQAMPVRLEPDPYYQDQKDPSQIGVEVMARITIPTAN